MWTSSKEGAAQVISDQEPIQMPHCMNKLDQHIFSEIQEVYVLNWCVILNWLWNGVEHNTHIFVLQYFICCVLMKKVMVNMGVSLPEYSLSTAEEED